MISTAVFDYDVVKYTIGSACEKREIKVTHPSGIEETFKTRTEFYGEWRKKQGGWLAEYNKNRDTPLLPDEFTILDVQTPEPLEFALNSVKKYIHSICEKLEIDNYYGYIGKGKSFRVNSSTLIEYKGQRANSLKPLHMEAIENYLLTHHDAKFVEELEADDWLVIDCYKKPDKVIITIDKDAVGCGHVNVYNPNTERLISTSNKFGELELAKSGIKGWGRKFFYHQLAYGDDADNYFANSAATKKWGEKSSYNTLHPLKNDKECLEALVSIYKKLYPEPFEFVGWRGDKLEVDWKYVLNENVQLAHMQRWEGDKLDIFAVMDKLGVKYGD